jgi:PilZ domain
MLDRRHSVRNKVIYGGVAEIAEGGASTECVVRDISKDGAHLEFSNQFGSAKPSIRLTIAKKGRSFLARIIWWRNGFVGVAFSPETYELPGSDLAIRLRRSEKKKRELQRRIKDLIGEG